MGNACGGGGGGGVPTSKLGAPLLPNDELVVAIPKQQHESISSYSPVEVINVVNPVLFDQIENALDQKATVAMNVEDEVSLTDNVESSGSTAATPVLDRLIGQEEPVSTKPLIRHDIFPNNDTYVGEYIMETVQPYGKTQIPLKHGQGTYTYADGSSFVGTYSRGQMHHGVFTHVQESHLKYERITDTSPASTPDADTTAKSGDTMTEHDRRDSLTDELQKQRSGDASSDPVPVPTLVRVSNDAPHESTRTRVVILAMSIYSGDFEAGKYHGYGKIIYVDNGSDNVSPGALNGSAQAKQTCMIESEESSARITGVANIDTYKQRLEVAYDGQWRNGRRQGFGRALLFDGRIIEGYWFSDRLLACVDHKYHFVSLSEDKIDRTSDTGSRRNSYRRLVIPREAGSAKKSGRTYIVEELAREVCPDGSVYVGAFSSELKRQTVRHSSLPQIDLELRFEAKGCASITFSNGDILSAHFRNGILYGRGMMHYKSSGNIYDGHFLCQERHTYDRSTLSDSEDAALFGRMRLNTGDLAGTVAFDGGIAAVTKIHLNETPYCAMSFLCHGEGKYSFVESGAVYVGQFADDKKEGTGVYIDQLGTSYRGEYVRDRFEGQGIHRWPDGSEYCGQWRNGKKCGPYGRLVNAIGDIYECAWFEGQKHGPGKVIYKCGDAYFGTFVNDLKHGQAETLSATGIYEISKYKEGEIKRIIQRCKPGQEGHVDMRILAEKFRVTMQEHSLSFAREECEYFLHQKAANCLESDPENKKGSTPTSNKSINILAQNHGNLHPLPGSVVQIVPAKVTGLKGVVSSVGKLIGISKSRSKQLLASPSPTKAIISSSD